MRTIEELVGRLPPFIAYLLFLSGFIFLVGGLIACVIDPSLRTFASLCGGLIVVSIIGAGKLNKISQHRPEKVVDDDAEVHSDGECFESRNHPLN